MESTHDSPPRGRSSERGPITLDDDDWTVCSDMETLSTCSSDPESVFPTWQRQDATDVFHLKRDEQDKPVYEAWNIHHFPDWRESMGGFKVLGVKVEKYEDIEGRVDVNPLPSVQSELAEMHLQGIEHFRAKHKRCWATRPFRGSGKTYEEALDERCRNLPEEVQTAITQLLLDRGRATSTRHRTRTWTVAVMREQLRHRFANSDFSEVKRHRLRFWKKPEPQAHMLYTVVIKGVQTKEFAGNSGVATFTPFSNPWAHADNAEIRRKSEAEHDMREARRHKRRVFSPPYRTRGRWRSVSPPAYRTAQDRYESPLPSTFNYRSDSPPPYRRYTRTASPIRSRSPTRTRVYSRTESSNRSRSPVRIRVHCRERNFDDGPFPPSPTPPYSYTPPPAVSAYHQATTAAAAAAAAARAFPISCRPLLSNPTPYFSRPPPPLQPTFTPYNQSNNAHNFIRPTTTATTAASTAPSSPLPQYFPSLTTPTPNAAYPYPSAYPSAYHHHPHPHPHPHPPQQLPPQIRPQALNQPCLACRATRPCPHYPAASLTHRLRAHCYRPIVYAAQSEFGQHPECGACAAAPGGVGRPVSVWSAASGGARSVSAVSSVGPIPPPAPNPFSPLTTPSLSSAGSSSSGGGSSVGTGRRVVVRRGSVTVSVAEPGTPVDGDGAVGNGDGGEVRVVRVEEGAEEEEEVVVRGGVPRVVAVGPQSRVEVVEVEDEDE